MLKTAECQGQRPGGPVPGDSPALRADPAPSVNVGADALGGPPFSTPPSAADGGSSPGGGAGIAGEMLAASA